MIKDYIRQEKFDQTLLMHHSKTQQNPAHHPAGSCWLLLRSSSRRAVSWAVLMDDDPPLQLFAGQQVEAARSITPIHGWKPFSLKDKKVLSSSKRDLQKSFKMGTREMTFSRPNATRSLSDFHHIQLSLKML